jgi:Tol biopolymer transport system component
VAGSDSTYLLNWHQVTASPSRLVEALGDRYRIERELGRGGMATVYLARDLRHGRAVAVKVLRPELAAVIGAERFLTEIRTTASLQHPHIVPLFDSGEVAGLLFYVMPYVEGESLRDRLLRERQLPILEALRITKEVGSALDYAHRHGVIHRDIKPENILLHEGDALVTDFGIARAVSTAGTRMTETGMSLGTPYYMSPEQATGEREITARADVYAMGVVLYEMLLGEPPFTGPTAQAVLAKVMTERPGPIAQRRERVPLAVEEAVHTALAKLPADRFASGGEFVQALERGMTQVAPVAQPIRALRRRVGVLLAIVGAAALAIGGFLLGRRTQGGAASPLPASRLGILAPSAGGTSGAALSRQLALSPDGSTVVYVGLLADGNNHLMRQRLDETEATPIPGGVGVNPQISPDGRWLLASRNNKPYRLPIQGGTPQPLPEELLVVNGAWTPSGQFWFSREVGTGFGRLARGDSVEPYAVGRGYRIQQFLDDHTVLVIQRPTGSASGPCLAFDLRTQTATPVLDGQIVAARYTAGYLVYVPSDGTLHAVAFDSRKRRVFGEPVRLASDVSVTGSGIAQLAVAVNGTVAYIPEEPRFLVFVNRNGASRLVLSERHNFHAPRFSPNGRRLAMDYTVGDGRDVWILTLADGTLSRATFDREGHDPTWTPDGRSITYSLVREGTLGIYRTRPGSAEPAESLLASDKLGYTGLWLPDGSALLTTGVDLRPNSGNDLALVRNGGRGPIEPLVASMFADWHPSLSSDGRWVAFDSDRSGQPQIYVQSLTAEGDPVQVSQDGGTEPVWGPSGRELFYRRLAEGKADLMVADLRLAPEVEVTARRALFPISDIVGSSPHVNYDISPDGRTFVMVRRSPATRIMVLQNLPQLVRNSPRAGSGDR